MIKAVTTTLSLAILLFATATVAAQQSVSQTAEDESIRRQEAIILLRKTLADAQSAQKRNDLVASSKLYEDSWTLVQRIGVGIETERKQTVSGFSTVRIMLADKAKKSGDLADAEVQVSRALRVDPLNAKAIALKKEVDKLREAQRGRTASPETMARLPEIKEQSIKTGTKVQDAIVLYQAGKLDEAETKLNEAMKEEPTNRAASYYLTLVKNARSNQVGRQRIMDGTDLLIDVQKAWTAPVQHLSLPVSNPYTRTNTVYTGHGRQAIYTKLDKIRLDEVFFPGVSLQEVIKSLREQAQKRDPDKVGINFIIAPIDANVTLQQQAPGADPFGAAPATPAQPAEQVDPKLVNISIDPPLQHVRLADVLEAITMVADKPIKYSVTDWGIVFSVKAPESLPLFIRTFKVNPNSFLQGLESVSGLSLDFTQSGGQGGGGGGGGGGRGGGGGGQGGGQGGGLINIPRVDLSGLLGQNGQGGGGGGGGGAAGGGQGGVGVGITGLTRTNTMDTVQLMVRNFFTAAGVDLGGTNSLTGGQGKAVFYNDRSGDLFVRATALDLDIIEQAIHVLDAAPHQMLIEAKFAEITQSDTKALGTDWYLGNLLGAGGKVGVAGGSAPSYPGNPTINAPANPSGVFPGTAGIPTALPSERDGLVTSGIRNAFKNVSGTDSTIPPVMTMTGILTDPQFRMVIRAIEQRDGTDILAAPKVLALSGRQAQISAVDIPTIVTGLNTQGQVGGGGGGAAAAGGQGGGNAAQTGFQFSTQQFPTGPTLDVIPYVSSDGFTIQMTILPVMTEFLGYDDLSSRFRAQSQIAVGGTVGVAITAETPLPRIRVRQVITHAIVWDGQTVMLGGLISEDVNKTKDKVPVLGDIPLLGRLFTSESNFSRKKNLVIFVTPTIIDPSGNRVHSPDRLPYDPNVVPPQKVAAQ